MKKQEEQISKKKNGFFNDDGDNKDFPDDASIEKESDFPDDDNDDVFIKQGSDNEIEEIDDRETIPYASPKRESEDEVDEKIYKKPILETAVETEKQAIIDEEKFIKTELVTNIVDLKVSQEAEIKKIQDIFDKVKEEEPLKDIEDFFINDNYIFDHDEISGSNRKFIMSLNVRTTFIADTNKLIEDTEASKIEIVDLTIKQKMEKRTNFD